jgi:hypothetical protein
MARAIMLDDDVDGVSHPLTDVLCSFCSCMIVPVMVLRPAAKRTRLAIKRLELRLSHVVICAEHSGCPSKEVFSLTFSSRSSLEQLLLSVDLTRRLDGVSFDRTRLKNFTHV